MARPVVQAPGSGGDAMPRVRLWFIVSVVWALLRTATSTSGLDVWMVRCGLVTAVAVLAFGVIEQWPRRLPSWLPRWVANPSWQGVALGHYTRLGFLGTAVLFAAEHGPFWEVGLLCGLIYNTWMWRTRSLGDLILVHAVTNAALGAVVLGTGRYEFWM